MRDEGGQGERAAGEKLAQRRRDLAVVGLPPARRAARIRAPSSSGWTRPGAPSTSTFETIARAPSRRSSGQVPLEPDHPGAGRQDRALGEARGAVAVEVGVAVVHAAEDLDMPRQPGPAPRPRPRRPERLARPREGRDRAAPSRGGARGSRRRRRAGPRDGPAPPPARPRSPARPPSRQAHVLRRRQDGAAPARTARG